MIVEDEPELVRRAVRGERLALEMLLLGYYDRLRQRMSRKVPSDLRGVVAADDIIQATFATAIRDVQAFEPSGDDAFYRWLATIAEHKLIDAIRVHRGRRTQGEAMRRRQAEGGAPLTTLLELLAAPDQTPSRTAASSEAVQAVQVALAALPEAYRRVLSLRYIEGWTVAAVAMETGRTERAVHGMCNRGLKLLRSLLGSESRFLTVT